MDGRLMLNTSVDLIAGNIKSKNSDIFRSLVDKRKQRIQHGKHFLNDSVALKRSQKHSINVRLFRQEIKGLQVLIWDWTLSVCQY